MKILSVRRSKVRYKIFILSLLFFLFLSYFSFDSSIKSSAQVGNPDEPTSTFTANQAFSVPIRIQIPSIGIDAQVESLGLTSEGAMDAPEGPHSVGWWKGGVLPGQVGSAVMDGHSGWKGGIKAVFDDLHKLSPGDKIYVQDEKGQTLTFVVRELRKYERNADTSEVFGLVDDKAHLNLITCNGKWEKFSQTSSHRLVVFSDKEV